MSGLAKQIMGGGISFGAAKAINGSVANALTATGTLQTDAYAINAAVAEFSTVGSGSGAILPSCEISDEVIAYNGGANALKIYPDVGSRINQLSANAAVTVAPSTTILFKHITSTRWIAILSA